MAAMLFTSRLLQDSHLFGYLGFRDEMSVPMVLVEYLNLSDDDLPKLKECISKCFNLELKRYSVEQIGSCIDLLLLEFTPIFLHHYFTSIFTSLLCVQ